MNLVRAFLKNPLVVLMEARRPVKKQVAWMGAVIPIGMMIFIALCSPLYLKSYRSVMTFGQLFFLVTLLIYYIHCFFISFTFMIGPLLTSFKSNTSDQIILTGLTPFQWVNSHLIFIVRSWFALASIYVPLFFLSFLVRGVSFEVIVFAVLSGFVFSITCCLFLLLLVRSLGLFLIYGIVLAYLYCGSIVYFLSFGDNFNVPLVELFYFSPIYTFLCCFESADEYSLCGTWAQIYSGGASCAVLFTKFLVYNIFAWCLFYLKNLTGCIMACEGIERDVFSKKTKRPLLNKGAALMSLIKKTSNRSISYQQLLMHFQKNSSFKLLFYGECGYLLLATIFYGVVLFFTLESVHKVIYCRPIYGGIALTFILMLTIFCCFFITASKGCFHRYGFSVAKRFLALRYIHCGVRLVMLYICSRYIVADVVLLKVKISGFSMVFLITVFLTLLLSLYVSLVARNSAHAISQLIQYLLLVPAVCGLFAYTVSYIIFDWHLPHELFYNMSFSYFLNIIMNAFNPLWTNKMAVHSLGHLYFYFVATLCFAGLVVVIVVYQRTLKDIKKC